MALRQSKHNGRNPGWLTQRLLSFVGLVILIVAFFLPWIDSFSMQSLVFTNLYYSLGLVRKCTAATCHILDSLAPTIATTALLSMVFFVATTSCAIVFLMLSKPSLLLASAILSAVSFVCVSVASSLWGRLDATLEILYRIPSFPGYPTVATATTTITAMLTTMTTIVPAGTSLPTGTAVLEVDYCAWCVLFDVIVFAVAFGWEALDTSLRK